MPNSDTMLVPSIHSFTLEYLSKSKVSVDPFARNCRMATYTNDLNPETAAEYHMDSAEFLAKLERDGVRPDLVIFDPPYSHGQIMTSYGGVGRAMTQADVSRINRWTVERDTIARIMVDDGIVLSFGWSSSGQGMSRKYAIDCITLVCHGTGHHDTICMAERKLPAEAELFQGVA